MAIKQKLKQRLREALAPTLEDWFYGWIVRQNTFALGWSPRNVYFEFGVAGGNSMMQYVRAVERYCKDYKAFIEDFRIVGFDSFTGLPEPAGTSDCHVTWQGGAMQHVQNEVLERIGETKFPVRNVTLIPGYFEKTLTRSERDLLGLSPSIVTIDCDYYSSASVALEWLKPILQSGTVFYFDDIWAFHGNPHQGELRAIHEFNTNSEDLHLEPCGLYGLDGHSYIFSKQEWDRV